MAGFMNSGIVRNLRGVGVEPGIPRKLEKHADRILAPTITEVREVRAATGAKVMVFGVFEEDRSPAKCGPNFKGKTGDSFVTATKSGYAVYVGLGKKDKFDEAAARKFGATAVREAEKLKSTSLDLAVPLDAERTESIVLGAVLASYRYDQKIGVPKGDEPTEVKQISLITRANIRDAIARGMKRADAQNTARYFSDIDSDALDAASYVILLKLFAYKHSLQFDVLTHHDLMLMGREGIATVGRGAAIPGAMVVLGNLDGGASPLDVLVGKGVVFDSGGYSLKTPSDIMNDMHMDMEGSAVVAGAMAAASKLYKGLNALAFLCIAQNAVGPNAVMPTAVIKIGDRTVQIMNTDAEGRLVMADGISIGAELKPKQIVSISTLTGACMIATGVGMRAGLMTTDDMLRESLSKSGDRTGEKLQHFHIDDPYLRKVLAGGPADLVNLGPRFGGHMSAQVFLKEFAHYRNRGGKEVAVPYAGLDIAPVMNGDGALAEDPRFRGAKFATGFGVQLLTNFLGRQR